MFSLVVVTLPFVAALAYMMRLDVRRIRTRDQILAIADPKSDVYRRNLTLTTTRWRADRAVIDAWSARVTGVWWFARAAYCVVAVLLIGGVLAWMQSQFSHGAAPFFLWPIPAAGIWMHHQAVRKTEGDLAIAELQRDHAQLVAGAHQ